MFQLRHFCQAMKVASPMGDGANRTDSKVYGNADSYLPWDNPDNVIAFQTFAAVENILTCYFNPVIFCVGVPANVLNCVVFFRQGCYRYIFCCCC